MSELLHNMSAPPRSEVKFSQEQLEEYISFNPVLLAFLLGIQKFNLAKLEKKVKHYYQKHPDLARMIEKPTGYMIAEAIELKNENINLLESKFLMKQYHHKACRNIPLLILVFASTVGDLYIPNRPLSFEENKFKRILLFPAKEVNS